MKKIYFGHAFKAARHTAGKTLKETAKALGISESFLSRLENGVSVPPREEMIIRAAEYFQIAPDDLLYAAIRQREGVHAILAARTVEAYGRLLQQFHQLDPTEIDAIDAILLRHSSRLTDASTEMDSSHKTQRSGRRQARTIRSMPARPRPTSDSPKLGSTRNGARHGASAVRAQRTARITHSPPSNLKSTEEPHDHDVN